MFTHDIGIVIVNYNVRHFLIQCLQSVRHSHTNNLKIDVWVVDNASVDGSQALISQNFPEVHLIANEKNVGFSAANNQAIKEMNAKYVLLLNPDTVLEEDTLQKCFEFMEDHPDAGAVGVRMIDGSGKFLPESKRKIPDLWNSFCKLTFLSDLFPSSKLFSGYNLGYLSESETNEVEVLCGAFMFMRNDTLEKTGLLDEDFFMYGEDIDLSYRILKAGYKIWYYPESSIIHYKGESTKKSSLNYVRTFYGAMHIYVNKHYGQGNAAVFARVIGVAISLRAMMSGLSRFISRIWRPVLDFVLIWLALSTIKDFWATHHFHQADYYENSEISYVLSAYSLVWVFFLWLGGQYDKTVKIWNTIFAIGSGTIFILLVYALLPENLRSSRAIILMGTISSALIATLSSLIAKIISKSGKQLSTDIVTAIVASKENALKLSEIVKKSGLHTDQIHYIFPGIQTNDTFYTNTIALLPDVVKNLKVNEVIYSSEDTTMKEIINSMSKLESKVSFKIGGDDSLSIIGSHSKNHPGELYSLDENYILSSSTSLRYKRIFDIVSSLCLLPISPILWVLNAFDHRFLLNTILVLLGKATWIGYGGEKQDFNFLPTIKQAVISYPQSEKKLSYQDGHFRRANIFYASNYSFFLDARILIYNLFKLSNKIK